MEGFTVALALVDAIPVLFFGGTMILISKIFDSPLFFIGAALSLLAAVGKVAWKFILGLKKKDVKFLNKAFMPTQCVGWVIMIIALILGRKKLNFPAMGAAIISMPTLVFFIIGVLGMAGMVYLKKNFKNTAKENWIAQCTNAVAQICIFLGFLFILF